MTWLGLDIGGANLKTADGRGWACTVPFALWRDPDGLPRELSNVIRSAPASDRIAVTMTGELCDCFATKPEGVRAIVSAVELAAEGRAVVFYLVDDRFVSSDVARELPHLAGASNWHALATFACRFIDSSAGLLLDVGSTTTDIIPIADGRPRPQGWNDTDRLLWGELVYTGVGRTPVCAITGWLPWRGQRCPVAAELFATAADAYVILDCVAEQLDASDVQATADGRPMLKEFARARLARMICADPNAFGIREARLAAERVLDAQLDAIGHAVAQVLIGLNRLPEQLVLSGSGEFLARRVVEACLPAATIVSLSERLGPVIAAAAPAHALAVLAAEMEPRARA